MAASADLIHDARRYRAFIDGLRAVAILTVVGSHTGLPGFHGGFVGVDIFFVISGYLIINHILEDLGNNHFSLIDFATRRTYRILPAFLVVMLACLVLATTIFVQPEHKEFAKSFFLSSIMLANHHYLAHQGYFDTAAFTKPLLHMWSLAVEEQFYLVAPLTLLGVTAATVSMPPERRRKSWIAVASGLAIVSFIACVIFTYPQSRPNVSFYIMPTRGWEFILGGAAPALALAVRRFPPIFPKAMAMAGLALIAAAVLLFDEDTLYPSWLAAAPVAGAALIIVGGLVEPGNVAARLLATPPMVAIGLVSYSWYLWHWPLISFTRTLNFGAVSVVEEVGAAAVALILAALTYRFVERPTRAWRQKKRFAPGFVVATGVASCIAVANVGYLWTLHVAPLMQPQLTGLTLQKAPDGDYPPVAHHGILLGDSHAVVIEAPLEAFARRAGADVTLIGRAGCPPLGEVAVRNDDGRIASYCDPFFQSIAFQGAEFAIIVARWNFYLGLPPSDPYYRSSLLVDAQTKREGKDPYELLARGLVDTIAQAKRAGVARILVVAPLPEFPWDAPYCVMRAIRVGLDLCTVPRVKVDARRDKTTALLRQVLAPFDGVRLIDPIDIFCAPDLCRPNDGTELFFSDSSHLSPAGTEKFYKSYQRDFLWELTGAGAANQ